MLELLQAKREHVEGKIKYFKSPDELIKDLDRDDYSNGA